MNNVTRYELEVVVRCGEPWQDLVANPDGDYVTYEDYRALQGRYDLLKTDWMTTDIVKLREELVLLRVENERLKETQQRAPEDWETVCYECDGSGWRARA